MTTATITMFLIERERPNQRRDFIVNCTHGQTDLTVDNYPRTDPARGSGIFEQLIKKHRNGMLKAYAEGAIDERCECRALDTSPARS